MAREINLVPDIKNDMIKAIKLRNLIFFISLIIGIASISVTAVVAVIAGGQQLALDNKKNTIDALSTKLNSYSDLEEFLTIKDQLGDINTLTRNKAVLSRTFNVLSALIPTGADTIKISELSVNLSGDAPTFTFDAQANAGQDPFIDYNVLDAFKKSMQFMRYDYGTYVDKNGNNIPAYCIIETGDDGSFFNDSSKGLYALWTINAEGCNPSATAQSSTDDSESSTDSNTSTDANSSTSSDSTTSKSTIDYGTEDYNGQTVVRIWRTPQFNDWYKEKPTEGQPYMDLNGQISGVQHFVSACTTYKGDTSAGSDNPKWTETNDNCLLVPEGEEGISIYDSSNGRNEGGELVLRFSAKLTLTPEVLKFKNSHMLALAPSGRRNVTDSYVQIQSMFGERAADCAEGDAACANAQTNSKDDERSQNG